MSVRKIKGQQQSNVFVYPETPELKNNEKASLREISKHLKKFGNELNEKQIETIEKDIDQRWKGSQGLGSKNPIINKIQIIIQKILNHGKSDLELTYAIRIRLASLNQRPDLNPKELTLPKRRVEILLPRDWETVEDAFSLADQEEKVRKTFARLVEILMPDEYIGSPVVDAFEVPEDS